MSAVTMNFDAGANDAFEEAALALERVLGLLDLIEEHLDGVKGASPAYVAMGTLRNEVKLADAWVTQASEYAQLAHNVAALGYTLKHDSSNGGFDIEKFDDPDGGGLVGGSLEEVREWIREQKAG